MPQSGKPRELTGRTVLLAVVAFFAVVVAANLTLARFALSTFSGVEADNAYKAGLAYSREIASARAQDARHWMVDARVQPRRDDVLVEIAAHDASGRPLAGFEVTAALTHPMDRRQDHAVPLSEDAPGIYRGATDVHAGQWSLVIEIARGGDRLFRSESRVQLR